MFHIRILLLLVVFAACSASHASNIVVAIDDSAAKTVLAAVCDPHLTMKRALEVAQLPGNQGLIRKTLARDHAAQTERVLAALNDPEGRLLAVAQERIARFTPA